MRMKDWTGKSHRVEVKYRKSTHPEWGEVWDVIGVVDGEEILLDYPFSTLREAKKQYWRMIRDLEYWLQGKHHPTHYRNREGWEYLAK